MPVGLRGLCALTLYYLLIDLATVSTTTTTASTTKETVFYCYDCNSANSACLGNATLDRSQEGHAIVVTNCTVGQRCFTRENKLSKTDNIYRGCTKIIGGNLPVPLPDDGCYDYNGDNFCICSGDRCNIKPIGEPTGVKMDAHLKTADGGVLPPPYVPRGNKKHIECNICNSGKPDESNFNCLAQRTANWKTTWKRNCTGRCITKTNFIYSDGKYAIF
ncbi:uncharacterized protein LOC135480855 [Liolophura sinensis]|uniref:uncharacterized protein LOC135480855 n=1 Tax=Liolophura sinensis TaxID=3198878 RepID=UPI0031587E3C